MFIVQVSLETELPVSGVPLRRWSWKGHLSVTLVKTLLCRFIVQVSRETELIKPVMFYLEDALGKTIHWWHWGRLCSAYSLFASPQKQLIRFSEEMQSWWSSTWKIVFPRLLISDTGEDSALHINCSDLLQDRALKVGVLALQGLILGSFQFGRVW